MHVCRLELHSVFWQIGFISETLIIISHLGVTTHSEIKRVLAEICHTGIFSVLTNKAF